MSRDATVESLVAQAQAGDRKAVEQLLQKTLPRVRNLVRYLVRGDAEVDDVAQESLAIVYRKLSSFRAEGAFTSWVDRIVVRNVFAHRRKVVERREVALTVDTESHDAAPGGEGRGDDYAMRRAFVRQLDELPEDQRIALVMHHVLEMSVPEIAAEVVAPEETIRSRLRLGRARLRAQTHEEEGTPS